MINVIDEECLDEPHSCFCISHPKLEVERNKHVHVNCIFFLQQHRQDDREVN